MNSTPSQWRDGVFVIMITFLSGRCGLRLLLYSKILIISLNSGFDLNLSDNG